MYEYNLYKEADNKSFYSAVKNVEKSFPNLKKHRLIVDVDGSLIQIFSNEEKEMIKLYNDYETDAVYAISKLNLDAIFRNEY